MSEIKLYVNTHTNINEGRECNIYFRKNDIIICLNYDLELNSLSNDELENLKVVQEYYYNEEEEYMKDIVEYPKNDKLEKIIEQDIENYNNATASEISVKKTIYKVNKKHLMIIDEHDVHSITTITNVFV
jgi:hypothetical protein